MTPQPIESLKHIPGIGDVIISRLKDAGYVTLNDLLDLTAEHLSDEISGIGTKMAIEIEKVIQQKKLVDYNQNGRNEFANLLKQLFGIEKPKFDFGIFKIMNTNRTEILEFIDQDLPELINRGLEKFIGESPKRIKTDFKQLQDKIIQKYGNSVINNTDKLSSTKLNLLDRYNFLKDKITQLFKMEGVIYNHLHDFYSRYFSNGDFISYPSKKGGSTNTGEETRFSWITENQYYIKSSEYYHTFRIKINQSQTMEFRVENQNKISNDEDSYFILSTKTPSYNGSNLIVSFQHRPLTEAEIRKYDLKRKRDKQRILNKEAIKSINTYIKSFKPLQKLITGKINGVSQLQYYLNMYTKPQLEDYFIHKDLAEFLKQKFRVYINSQIPDISELTSRSQIDTHLGLLQTMKTTGGIITNYLSQIENFKKLLWEKKKFVTQTEYCVTLDHIPVSLLEEVINNKDQIEEWIELYSLSSTDFLSILPQNPRNYQEFLDKYASFMIDTKFFDDKFKYQLLGSIDKIDDNIDGVIVKSDNFHTLNLLENKFQNKFRCIYIDPPYNTGSGKFVYKDRFRHSSWLSMMTDRLLLAKKFLTLDGAIYISCDDNEESELKLICNRIFGEDNFLAKIIWEKVHTRKNSTKHFSVSHDYILVYARSKEKWSRELLPRNDVSGYSNPDNDPKGLWKADPIYANNPYDTDYTITKPNGVELSPPEGQYWRYSKETFLSKVEQGAVIWNDGDSYPYVKRYLSETQNGLVPTTLFDREFAGDNALANKELSNILGSKRRVSYPKPSKLIQRILQINTSPTGDIILDFFAGSGTTAHAVINQNRADGGNRKYVLTEMGDYFDTVLKQRIQRLVYSSEWDAGSPTCNDGISHIFKYQYLEQYEDTLNNITFAKASVAKMYDYRDITNPDFLINQTKDSPVFVNSIDLEEPFNYSLLISNTGKITDTNIDLMESFSYLLGLWVSSEYRIKHGSRNYHVIEGKREDKDIMIIWRSTRDIDYKKDGSFIRQSILKKSVDITYTNGNNTISGVLSLDNKFKQLLGLPEHFISKD